jgi:hypothetical protein
MGCNIKLNYTINPAFQRLPNQGRVFSQRQRRGYKSISGCPELGKSQKLSFAYIKKLIIAVHVMVSPKATCAGEGA